MIGTAGHGTAGPGIKQIDHQRHMNADCGVQAGRGLPGPVSHPCDKNSRNRSRLHGNPPPVTGDDIPLTGHTGDFHLNPFQGRIHIACRFAAARFSYNFV